MKTIHYIKKVWIDSEAVRAETVDGLLASYRLNDWPRLATASEETLNNFWLSYGGIHWKELDEDLSFEGMFHQPGQCPSLTEDDHVCFDIEMISGFPHMVADNTKINYKP